MIFCWNMQLYVHFEYGYGEMIVWALELLYTWMREAMPGGINGLPRGYASVVVFDR